MDSLLEKFMTYLEPGAGAPPAELVEALGRECPAFTLPAVERLRGGNPDDAERAALSAAAALNAPDPAALYSLIGPDAMSEPFYPPTEEPATPTTDSAIDTFLETYGHAPTAQEDALLEELILNPQPDYAAMLEAEYAAGGDAPAAPDSQLARIEAFLKKPVEEQFPHLAETADDTDDTGDARCASEAAPEAGPVHHKPAVAPAPDPDSSLSESLAKIYIRQGKYDKAYEIITGLNLNFPEKSVYFADQLRFLQKLMLNRKYQ